jgi:hypothetical protein
MSLDREGHKLAVGELWRKGIVLDLDKPARPVLLKHPRVNGIFLSPDGRWAAASTFKGEDVPIWDLSQGDGQPPVKSLPIGVSFFSPDGEWLMVDESNGPMLSFYRVGSWELVRRLDRIDRRDSVATFTRDHRVMAVTTAAWRHLRLRDSATGWEWATLVPAPPQQIGATRFSPDGSQLALRVGRALQLWDLRALRRRLAALGLDWDSPPFATAAAPEDARPLLVEVDPRPPACGPLPLYEGEMKRTIAELGPDHPETAGLQALLGLHLLQQEKYADAEPMLRECLATRAKQMPDSWLFFNAKSMLGGSLLGQQKYAEAEPLLLDGYEGMRQREKTIPEPARVRLTEGLERIVQLYDAWCKKGQADTWRKKLKGTDPGRSGGTP